MHKKTEVARKSETCSSFLYRLSYPDHASTLHFTFIALLHLTDYYFPKPFSEYLLFNGGIRNRPFR
jgi:hypothetical protein